MQPGNCFPIKWLIIQKVLRGQGQGRWSHNRRSCDWPCQL